MELWAQAKQAMQAEVDQMNYSSNKAAAAKRVAVKSNAKLYKNESWDLVDRDGVADGEDFLKKLDKKTLPDSLQHKTTEELKKIIEEKKVQRGTCKKEIETVNAQREDYIANERKRMQQKARTLH